MRKHLFAAALILTATATQATAQDWSGAYAGGQLGFSQAANTGANPNPAINFFWDDEVTGAVAGAFAGYNFQYSNGAVIGVEADVMFGDVSGEVLAQGTFPNNFMGVAYGTTASLRARAGYDMGRYMPYIAIGVTSANVEYGVYAASANARGSLSRTETAPTVAIGADIAMGASGSLRVEVRHTDFGTVAVPEIQTDVPGLVFLPNERELSRTDLLVGYAFRF
ncbi:outer membrane beta-barrel protein [Gymnodinialimonas sp. 57CJ19]|uniref:outer membrane protein n=1 Tax=Gymnodinialimonas sp. 57CJ19 TaxID=3138498 RepID=UPI0031343ADB